MEDPRRSEIKRRSGPAQGRATVPGTINPLSRAQTHDGVIFMHVSTEWDHERFRDYVIRAAQRAQVAHDQASLSTVTGIDTGLLGRYFRGQVQPGESNLEKIQRAIPGVTMKDLRILAGRAKPEEYELSEEPTMPLTAHPRAEQVDRLLGRNSPLPESERELLDRMLDHVLSPYEKYLTTYKKLNGRKRAV